MTGERPPPPPPQPPPKKIIAQIRPGETAKAFTLGYLKIAGLHLLSKELLWACEGGMTIARGRIPLFHPDGFSSFLNPC